MSDSFDNISSTQHITVPIVGALDIVWTSLLEAALPTQLKYFLEKHKHDTRLFEMKLYHPDVVKITRTELAFY